MIGVIGRVKFLGWLTIFIILIFIIFIGNRTHNHQLTAVETITESKEWSKYPGLDLKTETKDSNTYTSSINTPITTGEKINKNINSWLEEQENYFFDEMERFQNIFIDKFRAHLSIQLETENINQGIYNLIFREYRYTGGANGINLVKSYTVDTENDLIITINDIFKLEEKNVQSLRTVIKEHLQENEKISNYLFENHTEKALEDFNELKWSINNQAFTLYFNEYEIAAGAVGPIEIDIPIADIFDYLSNKATVKLNIQPPEKVAENSNDEVSENNNQNIKKDEVNNHDQQIDLNPNGKYIALTFDDGPNAGTTSRILNTLNENNALATFFLLGSQVDYYPELAQQIAEEGHEIANHTNNHPDLTTLNIADINDQISSSRRKIINATGYDPTLIRPPYGAFNENVKQVVAENQGSIILWSVDSLDWKHRDPNELKRIVLKQVVPGSIILMHDIHATTADGLPALLNALAKDGYEFITVSQLLSLQEQSGLGPHYGTKNY